MNKSERLQYGFPQNLSAMFTPYDMLPLWLLIASSLELCELKLGKIIIEVTMLLIYEILSQVNHAMDLRDLMHF